MLASYVLSRTLVPTLAMYLLKPKHGSSGRTRNPFVLLQRASSAASSACVSLYELSAHRRWFTAELIFVPVFLLVCVFAPFLL